MPDATKVTAAVHEFERRILPARLSNVPSNVFAVMTFVSAKGLDPEQSESYITAAKAIYKSLEWAVKPAKLLVEENQTKVCNRAGCNKN
jgi:hypothetical protein